MLFSRAHWVRRIMPGGPAAKSGICEGDVISSIWKIGDGRVDGEGWGGEGDEEEDAGGKFGRGLKVCCVCVCVCVCVRARGRRGGRFALKLVCTLKLVCVLKLNVPREAVCLFLNWCVCS